MTSRILFEDSRVANRRRILFYSSVITGFLSVAAGTASFMAATERIGVGPLLFVLGLIAFGGAILIFDGRLDWLFEDDQVVWGIFGGDRG